MLTQEEKKKLSEYGERTIALSNLAEIRTMALVAALVKRPNDKDAEEAVAIVMKAAAAKILHDIPEHLR